ncbi:MAG: C-terminal helicase domain-containing protein [Polyangiaceae bacterium]
MISQLPALTEITRYTPVTPEQSELEEACRAEASKLMKIAEKRALSLQEQQRLMAFLLKARQACNALELADPTRGESSPKLDELENIMGELAQGTAKVLVFSEWTEMLKLASKRLESLGLGHSILHGGVPTDKRPALIEKFRTDPDQRVLLSTDAGGVGLNLQVATYVIHLDLPWNPGRLDQRTARAHRVGQTRGVSVMYLCSESGIERGIEGTLSGKRAVRSAALDPDSMIDELEAPSFSVFLRQVQEILAGMDSLPESEGGSPVVEVSPSVQQAVEALAEGMSPSTIRSDQFPIDRNPQLSLLSFEPMPKVTADSAAETIAAPSVLPGLATPAADAAIEPIAPSLRSEGQEQPVPTLHAPVSAPPAVAPALPKTSDTPATAARHRLRLATVVLEAGFPADAVRAAYEALSRAISSLLDQPAPSTHAQLVALIYRDLLPQGKLPPAAHSALARLHDLMSLEQHGVDVDISLARESVVETETWVNRLLGASLASIDTP